MSKARHLLRRIQSIKNTRKTTYAMKLVAGAKLRKIQDLTISSRAYEDYLVRILKNILVEGYSNPLFEINTTAHKLLYVVIGSSRGLCGGFNVNVKKHLDNVIARHNAPENELIVLGKKLAEILRFTGKYRIADLVENIPDTPDINFAQDVLSLIKSRFLSGSYRAVYVVYTNFFSVMAPKPDSKILLPLRLEAQMSSEEAVQDTYIFEPSLTEALDYLVPRLADIKMLQALLESKCSEHASRMIAMENATRNAGELVGKLTLLANKIRQSSITAEILDIIGGAEATVDSGQQV